MLFMLGIKLCIIYGMDRKFIEEILFLVVTAFIILKRIELYVAVCVVR